MPLRYLLDTNTISEAIKRPNGAVASRVLRAANEELATSIIVACELRFGVAKGSHPKTALRVKEILDSLKVLSFESPADIVYARTRANLEARGLTIGANDLFIASQAIAAGMILVTDNVREFSRIDELKLENWLRA